MSRNKTKRVLSVLAALAVLCCLAGLTACGKQESGELSVGNLCYTLAEDGTAAVAGVTEEGFAAFKEGRESALSVPATVERGGKSYAVTALGEGSFKYRDPDKGPQAVGGYVATLTLPASLRVIGEKALAKFDRLTALTVPEGVTELGKSALQNCTALTSLTLPASLTTIGDYAFSRCLALREVEVPGSVEKIPARAFSQCSALETVTLGEGVKEIGEGAFESCSSLETITLPATLQKIASQAFNTALKSITLLSAEAVELTTTSALAGTFFFVKTDELTTTYAAKYGVYNFLKIGVKPPLVTGESEESGDFVYTVNLDIATVTLTGLSEAGVRKYTTGGEKTLTVPATVTLNDGDLFRVTAVGDGRGRNEGGVYSELMFLDIKDSVEHLALPEGLEAVNDWAFANFTALKEIVLPDTVTEVGDNTFTNCPQLASIDLGGVQIIGDSAFNGCAVTELVLPDTVTEIGGYAFRDLRRLTSLKLSEGLQEITGRTTFAFCTALEQVTIPGSLPLLAESMFHGCTSLREVTIEEGVIGIDTQVFTGTAVTELTFPSTFYITTPDAMNFDDGRSLEITLLYTDDLINLADFVNIPDVTYYVMTAELVERYRAEQAAEGWNPGWTFALNMTIAAGEEIDDGTFVYTVGEDLRTATLTGITQAAYDRWSAQEETALAVPATAAAGPVELRVTAVGDGTKTPFALAGDSVGPYIETLTVADGVAAIAAHAFAGFSSINAVALPDSVGEIGAAAFSGCTALAQATLPATLSAIADELFADAGLTAIALPTSVSEIGADAFRGTALSSVRLPANVGKIGDGAFAQCAHLTEAVIGKAEGLVTLGAETFGGATVVKVASLALADSYREAYPVYTFALADEVPHWVPVAGEKVVVDGLHYEVNAAADGVILLGFANEAAAAAVTGRLEVPARIVNENTRVAVVAVGEKAFKNRAEGGETLPLAGKMAFTGLSLPASVTEIGAAAFQFCDKLVAVDFSEGLLTVGASAFNGASLSALDLPASLTRVNDWAFAGSKVTHLDVPGTVTTWGTAVFANAANLRTFSLPANMTRIPDRMFDGASALTDVVIPDHITWIGTYNFRGAALRELIVPAGVTTIDDYAFYNCPNLAEVYLYARGATAFGINTFYNGADEQACILYCYDETALREMRESALGDYYAFTLMPPQPGMTFEVGDCAYAVGADGRTAAVTGFSAGTADRTRVTVPEQVSFRAVDLAVTAVGKDAFRGEALGEIVLAGETAALTLAGGAFLTTEGSAPAFAILVPEALLEAYRTANQSYLFEKITAYVPVAGEEIEAGDYLYVVNADAATVSVKGFAPAAAEATTVSLPSSVTHRGVVFPVTAVAAQAFQGKQVTELALPDGLVEIGDSAFQNTKIAALELPASVRKVGGWTFAGTSLTALTVPAAIVEWGDGCFAQCAALTAVTVEAGATTIPKMFFRQTGLTEITLPASVRYLAENAFWNATSLRAVRILAETLFEMIPSDPGIGDETPTVYVLTQALVEAIAENYGAYWYGDVQVLPPQPGEAFEAGALSYTVNGDGNSVTVVGPIAAHEADAAVTVPATVTFKGAQLSVTAIGAEAFQKKATLTAVALPDGLVEIGASAFNGTQLATVVWPSALRTVGDWAFAGNLFTELTLPEGVAWGNAVFAQNRALTAVTLPADLSTLPTQFLRQCTALQTVDAPTAEALVIGDNALTDYDTEIYDWVPLACTVTVKTEALRAQLAETYPEWTFAVRA